jgi:restriction system protein
MAIPKYDEMTLPILQALSDGEEHARAELIDRITHHFNLKPEDQALTHPNWNTSYLKMRIGWAVFALTKADLATETGGGALRITNAGRQFLATNPTGKLGRAALKQFESFRRWSSETARRAVATRRAGGLEVSPPESAEEGATPAERIQAAFIQLQEKLITDVRAKLATTDPFRFEKIVLNLLKAMGYGGPHEGAAQVTQKTGDHGVDGFINEDRLGLDVIYVQAKRWKNNIGRVEIQNFVGALAGKKANKGIFITTSDFHDNAHDYAAGLHQKVILVDGRRLAELMIEHSIGVAEEHAYSIKKVDSDYFDEA